MLSVNLSSNVSMTQNVYDIRNYLQKKKILYRLFLY